MNAPAEPETGKRRLAMVTAPLLIMEIALWLALFLGAGLFRAGPNGKSLGTDFAVFSGAALAIRHGANPYDSRTLYRYERALLLRQKLPVTDQIQNVRAGNPPLFYWALQPLTDMPFEQIAIVWILGLWLVSGLAFLGALIYLGWRRFAWPLAIFLLMPQVVLGACYGNIHGVVFASLVGALLLSRRFPFLAGMMLSVGWLKPQLALPLVVLIIALHSRSALRMVTGFSAATAALLGASAITVGPATLGSWLRGLADWSRTVGLEPNLSSLVGLYAGWAAYPVRIVLGITLVATVAALTAATWKQLRGHQPVPFLSVAWLWSAWFLAAPFAHFPDEILLALPIAALVGRDGSRLIDGRAPALALYLAFASLLLFPSPGLHVNLLSSVVIVLTMLLYQARACSLEPQPAVMSDGELSTALS